MSQVSIEQAFQIALQHHQAGQLSQAATLYREIIASSPTMPNHCIFWV